MTYEQISIEVLNALSAGDDHTPWIDGMPDDQTINVYGEREGGMYSIVQEEGRFRIMFDRTMPEDCNC